MQKITNYISKVRRNKHEHRRLERGSNSYPKRDSQCAIDCATSPSRLEVFNYWFKLYWIHTSLVEVQRIFVSFKWKQITSISWVKHSLLLSDSCNLPNFIRLELRDFNMLHYLELFIAIPTIVTQSDFSLFAASIMPDLLWKKVDHDIKHTSLFNKFPFEQSCYFLVRVSQSFFFFFWWRPSTFQNYPYQKADL